ncbi:E3 SUMO-protein ligase ZBED1-like [Octopus vulgaris]|uniref:E3 SUMO-protein ligase ZBED1-like n=1 Tax=Octopus vulgaris TaxID=6645 RepID=A0AA36BC30_OCTVU|nr:E3 SUMO-protein ligase ZBED1-like [Octopus vulgaris]
MKYKPMSGGLHEHFGLILLAGGNIISKLLISFTASIATISTVEDDGLQQVLRTALQNAEYQLPCRRTIDKILADIYNSKRESVKEAVKSSKAIALMSDFWTSLGNESYGGITGHWIADDWNLISVILECVHAVECHYSNNGAKLYKEFVKDWDITKKIQVLHMTVNDDDPGYIARFKAASVNGFSKRVTDMESIEILQIPTALDPRYKNLKCLSDDSKEQTWLLVGQQIAVDVNDDRLKTNAQDDTNSFNKTIYEPIEKRIELKDSDLEEGVENASDEVLRYKMEKEVAESIDPLQW